MMTNFLFLIRRKLCLEPMCDGDGAVKMSYTLITCNNNGKRHTKWKHNSEKCETNNQVDQAKAIMIVIKCFGVSFVDEKEGE